MQAAMEVPPTASEVCPAGHVSHAPAPASALYEPVGQAVHALGRPVKPALHWQVVVPAMNAAFGEHGEKHAELACAPAGEVWPVGQAAQAPALA